LNEQEKFLMRWARLKREEVSKTQSNPAENHRPGAEESSPPEPALDAPAMLPTVGSITGDSDIRPFLQSDVPMELVRAALRAAWTTDPAIRDFVGIAESQWDFNDPTAMPGFGPLSEVQSAQNVVRPSISPVNSAPDAVERRTEIVNPQRDGQVDDVWLSSNMEHTSRARKHTTAQATNPRQDDADFASRRHGTALPR
jgi:hypothetical protein